ncbi:hypothetical protein C8J56DRAFT_891115 [Mycena floridula]|nr:hypothetical protein C8J56DRAFT_891115 [Mycena floridula]
MGGDRSVYRGLRGMDARGSRLFPIVVKYHNNNFIFIFVASQLSPWREKLAFIPGLGESISWTWPLNIWLLNIEHLFNTVLELEPAHRPACTPLASRSEAAGVFQLKLMWFWLEEDKEGMSGELATGEHYRGVVVGFVMRASSDREEEPEEPVGEDSPRAHGSRPKMYSHLTLQRLAAKTVHPSDVRLTRNYWMSSIRFRSMGKTGRVLEGGDSYNSAPSENSEGQIRPQLATSDVGPIQTNVAVKLAIRRSGLIRLSSKKDHSLNRSRDYEMGIGKKGQNKE